MSARPCKRTVQDDCRHGPRAGVGAVHRHLVHIRKTNIGCAGAASIQDPAKGWHSHAEAQSAQAESAVSGQAWWRATSSTHVHLPGKVQTSCHPSSGIAWIAVSGGGSCDPGGSDARPGCTRKFPLA